MFKEERIQFYNLRKQELVSEKDHTGRAINVFILTTMHKLFQLTFKNLNTRTIDRTYCAVPENILTTPHRRDWNFLGEGLSGL